MQCPVCRRVSEGVVSECPRCGVELASLFAVENAAERLRTRGLALLRGRRPLEALGVLQSAERLHRTPATRRAIAVAFLCAGRFESAMRTGE